MRKNQKKALKFSFSIGFFLCSLAFLAQSAQAATYYVDSSRPDDSGNGLSQGAAWKTIDKVNNSTFYPGDNILFKRGEIWREQLTVPSSGTAGNPITFGAYGSGVNPKIYRTDLYNNWWEHSLMANGGMEYVFAGSPNDDFNDWSEFNWGDGTSIKGDTSVKSTGNTSARLTSTGNGQAFSGTNMTSFTKYMTVSANADYYFKVSGRVGVSGDNALLLRIKDTVTNMCLNSNGNWQSCGTNVTLSWNGTTPNTWAQKTLTFKPGSTSLVFEFYNFQNGSAWLDDAYFMQGTGPSATRIWAGTINGNSNTGGAVLNGKRIIQYLNYCGNTADCIDHGYDPVTGRMSNPFNMASGYFNAPLNTDYFYYRSDSGPPPTMDVGARLDGILISGKSYIVIDSIDVGGPSGRVNPWHTACSDNKDAGGSGLTTICDSASNVIVKNSDVENSDVVGIWSGNTTTNISYQNLTVHDNQNTGAYLNSQGGSVINCKVYDNGRLSTDGGDMGGIGSYQGGNILISGNEVYHNGPDDREADFEISIVSPTNPFTITKNYVHDCIQGCLQIAQGGDNSVVAYNVISGYGTGMPVEYSPGGFSGIKIGGGIGGAKGVKILNNIIAGGAKTGNNGMEFNGGGGFYDWPTEGGINFSYDDSNAVVKNNIFFNNANRDIYVHNQGNIDGAVFDNNIYYRASYVDNWYMWGYPENSLAAWQSKYSQDAHSSISNPLFTNASGNFSRASDFQLSSGSPAKDAGTDVSLTSDYAGTSVPQNSTPDIGAYEYFITYSAADINRDSSINLTDFNILKTDFLKLAAALVNPRSDIDGDGQCTVRDVGILMSGWK